MAGILNWLTGTSSPTARPRIPSDEVAPVHFFDDTAVNRQLFVCLTLRFRDVLDVARVHGEAGRLEIHIPRPFTTDRPAVRYSHTFFDQSIADHPLASKLPARTSGASIQAGPDEFLPLGCREGMPMTLAEHLAADEPQLQLHTVSFADATLVSLTWPHVTSDAVGIQSLVKAWSAMMAGKPDSVPRFLGFDQDPLETVGEAETAGSLAESPPLPLAAQYQLDGWSLVRAFMRFLPSHIWWPTNDSRTIFLPAAVVQKLRESALADLSETDREGNKTFLSENDVVTAWVSRLVSSHIPRTSSKDIMVQNVFDMRSRLSTLQRQVDGGGAFVQNLAAPAITVLPASVVHQRPLGYLASELRQTIKQQVTEPETQALFRLMRRSYATKGRAPIFGTPDAFWVFFTSWTKCKVWESVDFSAAVVRKSRDSGGNVSEFEERGHRPGRPDYFHSFPVKSPAIAPNGFQVAGKDSAGNFWIVGKLQQGIWAALEDGISRLAT